MSNSKSPLLTKSTLKIASMISIVMVLLYLLFNIFSFLILDYQLELTLDSKIDHEIEHFKNAIKFENDSLILLNPNEFNESDLVTLTETPFLMQIYDTSGTILMQSKNIKYFTDIPVGFMFGSDRPFFENMTLKEENLRVGYSKIYNSNGNHIAYIQLATFKSTAKTIETDILIFNLLSFPVFLVLIAAISIFLAKRSYAPINKIVDIAKNISATNLSSRISFEAKSDDELGKLRDTLNELFERLDEQIKQIRNFTDNASHQLMSPLTVLKSELEYILSKKHENSESLETLSVMSHQTDRMIKIVRTLLILAKECNACYDERKIFNLSKNLSSMQKIFLNKNLILNIEEDLYVIGNGEYFSLAIQNIIENAFKYSPDGTPVNLNTKKINGKIHITICDQGSGIKASQRERVFERFYRGEIKTGVDGFGLGLSLVKEIVTAMSGLIDIHNNTPHGTCFTIILNSLSIE